MPLVITCPYCHHPLTAADEHLGLVIHCPTCRKPVRAPESPPIPVPMLIPVPPPPSEFSRVDEPSAPRRSMRPQRIEFPVSFHLAAWVIITTAAIYVLTTFLKVLAVIASRD
jgi:hypothetical protein